MFDAAYSVTISQFRGVASPDGLATDGHLLTQFARTSDEAAFTELVRRLGPIVLGVCRRITGDHHLADDAFQATFVVLARRAADIRPPEAVGSWLYGVAVRTAQEARKVSARRLVREQPVAVLPDRPSEPPVRTDPDTLRALDEEIARLAENARAAVVLCELAGMSRQVAAARLGISEGTLSSRLARARVILAERLQARGVSLPAAGMAVVLGQLASAQVSRALVARTVASALTPEALSVSVASLATGVTRALLPTRPIFAPLGVTLLATVMIATAAIGIDSKATPPGLKETVGAAPPDEKSSPPGPNPKGPNKPLPVPIAKGPNKLLFYREAAGGTYVLADPDGRNEKPLTEIVGAHRAIEARFSPDGAFVSFIGTLPRPPEVPLPAFLRRLTGTVAKPSQRAETLFLRRLDGKGPEMNLGPCDFYAWSPNGAEIAIGKWGDRVDEAVPFPVTHSILNVKTQQKAPLKLPASHRISDWSPDGRYFLATSMRIGKDGPESCIYMLNRDGTEHKALSGPTEPSRASGRFSPDGTRVLCAEYGPPIANRFGFPRKLVVIEVVSGKATPVPDTTVQGEIFGFCWSPDGKKIAYSWREHHNVPAKEAAEKETESRLVVCDADGKNPKTILTAKGNGESAVTIIGPDWR